MPPYKFSATGMSLLEECQRCFWLQHNKGIKRPEGIFPSLPSGMDKILKTHFDSFMEKGKLPPELKDIDDVKLFDNRELLEEWRNNRKGIIWEDKEKNIFRGAIDNILKKGKKLIVLDYKTRGFPLKEDTASHYQNQLNIYNLLLRKNNRETEDYAYLLFYHPDKVNSNGDVVFNTDLIKMEISVKNAEKIFKEALRVLKEKIPEANDDCKFCGWNKENKEL
ncbi:PD-(D/E)XK nuclease family protein [Candidatus Woesearchaeota archaeon]|nr:PD-(D/E)XK nuclease family protein [Candidatus Woesearchaeota archaeon]